MNVRAIEERARYQDRWNAALENQIVSLLINTPETNKQRLTSASSERSGILTRELERVEDDIYKLKEVIGKEQKDSDSLTTSQYKQSFKMVQELDSSDHRIIFERELKEESMRPKGLASFRDIENGKLSEKKQQKDNSRAFTIRTSSPTPTRRSSYGTLWYLSPSKWKDCEWERQKDCVPKDPLSRPQSAPPKSAPSNLNRSRPTKKASVPTTKELLRERKEALKDREAHRIQQIRPSSAPMIRQPKQKRGTSSFASPVNIPIRHPSSQSVSTTPQEKNKVLIFEENNEYDDT